MTVPLSIGQHSVQCFVALNVAGPYVAPFADKHDLSLLGVVANVADPVVDFFVFLSLPLHLCRLYDVDAPLILELRHLSPTEGALVAVTEPFFRTLQAELVAALEHAPVPNLVQAYPALVVLQFPHLLEPPPGPRTRWAI